MSRTSRKINRQNFLDGRPAIAAWRPHLLKSVLFFVAAAAAAAVLPNAPRLAADEVSKPHGFEPGEENPGGAATHRKSVTNRNAFSHSPGNLSFEKELDFKVGNGVFRKLWVSAPSSTTASDGLGPLYNARSCQRCHIKDGRGHPPAANWPDDTAVSMFLRLSIPPQTDADRALLASRKANVIPEPTYGGQLQDVAIQGHKAEGKMHIDYTPVEVTLAGGETVTLRKPTYSVKELGYGPMHPQVMLSPRVAPQMIGLGLLEAIPEEQIIRAADPEDKDGDGISGRANRVWSRVEKRVTLGRFGWKAGNPDLRQQAAEAFAGDIGVSTPLVPRSAGDCTPAQAVCLAAPNGDGPREGPFEAGKTFLDLVTFYSQNLAVPRRRSPKDPSVLAGKALFHKIGCARCHTPKFVTGTVRGQPHHSKQTIWPYTDMLLHDMGDGLADNRPEGVATGREWRTAPLWGIGLTTVVNKHSFFLHDGRAHNIQEAILWHGGEAQKTRDAYRALTEEERAQLLAFVNSL